MKAGSDSVPMSPASGTTPIPEGTTKGNDSLMNGRNFKFILLLGMVLQNSMMSLIGRYVRSSAPKEELCIVNHLVFVIEVGKFVLSCLAEFHTSGGQLFTSLDTHIFKRPADAMKSLIPALLYLLQNTLQYVALSNLTAPMFQVTYQGKLVTTAIVSVLLLNRKYNIQQWICLVILSLGVAIVVLTTDEKKQEENSNQNLILGLTCVTISCFSSAFAGVYFEKVLKTESKAGQQVQPSIWMRNIQLSFFSILTAYASGLFTAKVEDAEKPYFFGFTFWVWFLVFIQSAGGLLVAAVMKYADNVLKGLATGVSVVLATAVSITLFGVPLTLPFSVGGALILGSAYYFSNALPTFCTSSGNKSSDPVTIEAKAFLPK